MFLKWHTLSKCIGQCALLAVPGVMVGSSIFAVVAHEVLPFNWDWELCLAFGAVMSATDPVAVVSLLNQLGAPPSLTMIIGGESLLNDGSAMIIWTVRRGTPSPLPAFLRVRLQLSLSTPGSAQIFFKLYMGDEFDVGAKVATLAIGSPIIGLVFGVVWRMWLGAYASSLDHSNGVTQTGLTIGGAYACFYMAEGVFEASGVMAVVFMGGFLAGSFWPVLADPVLLTGTWHTLEWAYNTVLFQLTGLVIGSKFIDAAQSDGTCTHCGGDIVCGDRDQQASCSALELDMAETFGWAVMLYVFAIPIRYAVVALFYPLLQRMGYGMTWQGAVVAGWGGLRGAVGLALALVMKTEMAQGGTRVDANNGVRVIVFVSTTAILTLLVNAPTTGPLVRKLGLTQIPKMEIKALANIKARIRRWSVHEFGEVKKQFEWGNEPEDKEWESWVAHKLSFLGGNEHAHGHPDTPKKQSILSTSRFGKFALSGLNHESVESEANLILRQSKNGSKEGGFSDSLTEASLAPVRNERRKKALLQSAADSQGASEGPPRPRVKSESGGAINPVPLPEERSSARGSLNPGSGKGIMYALATSGGSPEPSGENSKRTGKQNFQAIAKKVQTSILIVDRRERVGFVRSMFCRHLKLIYDNLVRSQLSGFPGLALGLRYSVDQAKDMVERAPSEESQKRLADLSIVLRITAVNSLFLYMARNPDSCLPKLLSRWAPRQLRQWARSEAVRQLITIMCYLTAHKEAQARTRDILGSYTKDEWSAEVHMVVNESVKSEEIAIEYFSQLEALKLGEESMTQLTRGLRARRAALELTSRLSNYIHHLHLDGAIQDAEEHELLHTLEHDAEHLKGLVAPTLDGTAGRSFKGLPFEEIARFIIELDALHKKTQRQLLDAGYGETYTNPFMLKKVTHASMHDHDKDKVNKAMTTMNNFAAEAALAVENSGPSEVSQLSAGAGSDMPRPLARIGSSSEEVQVVDVQVELASSDDVSMGDSFWQEPAGTTGSTADLVGGLETEKV